jgi:hypothetical protein
VCVWHEHRGHIGAALLTVAGAALIATDPTSVALLILAAVCLVAAIWVLGVWRAIRLQLPLRATTPSVSIPVDAVRDCLKEVLLNRDTLAGWLSSRKYGDWQLGPGYVESAAEPLKRLPAYLDIIEVVRVLRRWNNTTKAGTAGALLGAGVAIPRKELRQLRSDLQVMDRAATALNTLAP